MVDAQLPNGDLAGLAGFALADILAMIVVGLLISLVLRLSRLNTAFMVLAVSQINAGNYGLTFNLLRYGQPGLQLASVFFTMSALLTLTLGVFIASLGTVSWKEALRRLFRQPVLYAALFGVAARALKLDFPTGVDSALHLAASGMIPLMLVLLGMQIADTDSLEGIRLAIPAALARVAIGPLVAVGLAMLFGLEGLEKATGILEASMPTAVVTTILATEFGVRPRAMTSAVLISTLLTVISLPLVIQLFNL